MQRVLYLFCGDEITLIAEGPDEEEALKAVSESFRKALQD